MGHLIRYITKAPVSLERLTFEKNKVILKGEFHKGNKRNFETFDPDDFLAAYTSHIPKYRQKYVNSYGLYSNRTRGANRDNENDASYVATEEADASQKKFKRTWAMLLQKLFEVDPLRCPRCNSKMKVIAIIDDKPTIRKILEHLGLWQEQRGPPVFEELPKSEEVFDEEISSEPFDDGWGHGAEAYAT